MQIKRVAEIVVNECLHIKSGDKLHVRFNPGARSLASSIAVLAKGKGAQVTEGVDDLNELAKELISVGPLNKSSEKILKKMAEPIITAHEKATHIATLRCNDANEVLESVPSDILAAYWAIRQPRIRKLQEILPSVIIHFPSVVEAKIDNIPYKKSLSMFYEACLVDPYKAKKGQEVLIDYLKGKHEIEIFAGRNQGSPWKSHIKFSIEGQHFAAEGISDNLPGFEVLGSPKRGTISGVYSLSYPVMLLSRRLPNITLHFKNGKVTNGFVASPDKKYQEWVNHVLSIDSGAREVGEVAFGCNPFIDSYTVNKLIGEKIGGSFHLALGRDYEGNSFGCDISNGVRSSIHEDLTCMLWKRYGGGEVYVDGELIQKDGLYCGVLKNTELKFLNPGHC
jgi:aminopeptidase